MDIDGIKRPAIGQAKQTRPKTYTTPQLRGTHMTLHVQGTRGQRLAQPVRYLTSAAPAVQPRRKPDGLRQPETVQLIASAQMALPEPPRPRRRSRSRVQKPRVRWSKKSIVLRTAAVCFVLLLSLGGLLSWNGYVKMHKVFRGTATVAALAPQTIKPFALNGEGDGRVNVLLLGIGGPGHDGPDLTDTIVLFSVDPVNNTASMLSIPRDLWVDQPIPYFGKQQKINAAYESGKYHYLGRNDSSNANAAAVEAGFANIDDVIHTVAGVTVNYHVLVNFQAFRQAIDTVDGVDVNVPEVLIDPTMAWENHNNPVLAAAGMQHMDGVQALLYARSRETTSDFARGQRQRQILVALKDKVLTAGTLSNPVKLEELMNAFGDNVYSDLSTQGAERLYSILRDTGDGKISSIGLTDQPHKLIQTDYVGDMSVDRPVAGFGNYGDLQAFVRSQLPDGYIVKEHAPLAVFGPTADAATTTGTLLESYGYNVVSTATTAQPVQATTLVDLSHGKDPFTLHYLENRYGVHAVHDLPADIELPIAGAKFVIIDH